MDNDKPRAQQTALRALTLRIKEGDATEEFRIYLDAENNLVGFQNIEAVRAWIKNNPKDYLPSGSLDGLKVTDETKRDIRFFTDRECWFEGCEELRAEYKKELASLSANAACKPCEKGALMRKYLEIIADKQK